MPDRPVLRLRGRRLQERNAQFLAENPLCAECTKQGRVSPAAEVDHMVPLFKGGADEYSNWQGLCVPCHKVKTAKDMGYRHTGNDASGQPTDPNHPWNKQGGGGSSAAS